MFISYHVDSAREIVQRIRSELERREISCWNSEKDVKPGEEFAEKATEQIETCLVFLLVLDDGANSHSLHVLAELKLAVKRHIREDIDIIPFILCKSVNRSMEYYLENFQKIECQSSPTDQQIRNLADHTAKKIQVQRKRKAAERRAKEEEERRTRRTAELRKALVKIGEDEKRLAMERKTLEDRERQLATERGKLEAELNALTGGLQPSRNIYVVLYSDGELVFQNHDGKEAGRTVTGAWKIDPDNPTTPWCAIRSNGLAEKTYTAERIRRVTFADWIQPVSTRDWFRFCTNLKSIHNIKYLDTHRVRDMFGMFSGCSSLTSLDVSGFHTNNVTDMMFLFAGCSSLKTILASNHPFEEFVTPRKASSGSMFYGCTSLIGGEGTEFSWVYTDAEYARIDGGPDAPGYFTEKE